MTKLQDIKHEDFREVQPDMKLCAIEQARLNFSLRTKLYDCTDNYHGKYDEDNRVCPDCFEAGGQDSSVVESQSHPSVCPHYSHLRQGRYISTTEGMVDYFQAMLYERDKKK